MNKQKVMDMTKGNPFKMIILFTIPLILGNIFQQLYNVGDTKVVSYFLDVHSFAAVGMTAVVSHFIVSLINGFTQGFGILTATAFGMKDPARIRRNVAGSAVLTLILTAVMMASAFIFIKALLKLLNTPDELMDLALSYIRIIFLGIPFSSLYNLTANQLRSIGNSKTPLYCLLGSIVLNIFLDIIFVGFIFRSIEGAAYATVISQMVCSSFCTFYAITRYKDYLPKGDDWKVSTSEYSELFLTGLSMGMMVSIVNVGTMILQGAINSLGPNILAAHTAGRRLLEIQMAMVYTYGFTMSTYVSQNYGAKKPDRIRAGVKAAFIIATTTSLVLALFSTFFSKDIVSWISSSDNPVIVNNADMYNKIGVYCFPILGPLFILRCSLQGMGHKTIPLISSILELIVKILSAFFLIPAIGYLGVSLTEPISWLFMTIILTVGYIISIKKLNAKWSKEVSDGAVL